MNYKAIHETIIQSLVAGMKGSSDFVRTSINRADARKLKRTRNTNVARSNSIARASSGLVFTYPTLCSSSLGIKQCMMVGKALERRNVTMLQMLLAANQWTKQNIMDYLKDFHTNLDYNKLDVDDLLGIMNDDVPKLGFDKDGPKNESYTNTLMNLMPIREKNMALEDFRNNTNYFFEEDVNESSIGRFVTMKRNGYQVVIEADDNKDDVIIQALPNDEYKDRYNQQDPEEKRRGYEGDRLGRVDDDKKPFSGKYDSDAGLYNGRKIVGKDADTINKITAPNNNDRLLSSEVKKANEMVPSLMLINTIDPDTGVNMQSVIGVKSRIIPVPSNEVVGRILANYNDSNAMLKFVKLTTREISFIKDFLLAVDSAKLDTINNSKKGSSSSLFRALERRAQNGKIRKLAKTEKQFAKAISALVISQEDVEDLKKYNNVDVEIPRVISPIMEKLNLLYFVIVDESAESVKLFIDGATDYEVYNFSSLEKEAKDDGYKKVLNLMTKMTN